MLVVFNKLDLAAAARGVARLQGVAGRRAAPASWRSPPTRARASTSCVRAVAGLLPDLDGLEAPPDPAGVVVHRLEAAGDGYTIEREDGAFRVRGKRIERLTNQTNFENEESAERFQRELVRTGIDAALRKAGIRPATRSGSPRTSWSGSRRRTTSDVGAGIGVRRAARAGRAGLGGDLRRDVRPDPPRPSRDRRGGARGAGPRGVLFVPAARVAASSRIAP